MGQQTGRTGWGRGFVVVALVVAGCTSTADEPPPEPTTASPTSSAAADTATTSDPQAATATVSTAGAGSGSGIESAPTDDAEELPVPRTATELARQLSEAEMTIRLAAAAERHRAEWGREQQRMYRILAQHPEWSDEVVAAVDPSVRFAVAQNWAAREELSSLVTSTELSDVLPAWRIRDPLPVDTLLSYYREAEAETGVGWNYLAAIHLVETRMGRIEGLSTAGATGPMQFLPSTWEECCEGDPTIDRDAITGAGVYLARSGAPDDMERALRRYNNSQYYVNAVSAYAAVLEQDPEAYNGYHAWEVYFLSSAGLIVMPVGFEEPEPVSAAAWLAANPDAAAPG